MNQRVTMEVKMELCSDAIFGSGYSVPAGEDIGVCRDANGYPYLRGSTLKGLLRQSLMDLLAWTSGTQDTLDGILGREGWAGGQEDRQIQLTDLTMKDSPRDPEDCFSLRTFTAMENGVVKSGSLRTAACIRRGSKFRGWLECDSGDEKLIRQALKGIKWAGTMRSRGFGRVQLTAGKAVPTAQKPERPVEPAYCLFYRLRTESRVLLTDAARSTGNEQQTWGFIPGSAVRGWVIGTLARRDPDWFSQHREALLTEETRFLDAMPSRKGMVPLPSVMGFYEDKEETVFESVVVKETFTPGLKRAKTGSFCALNGHTMDCWRAATGGTVRINRSAADTTQTQMFQTHCLEPGQTLEGYIFLRQPELALSVAAALSGDIWLGADRFSGYGRCRVEECKPVARPAWQEAYGCQTPDQIGQRLYMLALSPVSMVNQAGEICGLDEKALACALEVDRVQVIRCSTAVSEYGGYNRTWSSRIPTARMYDRGSLFLLECSSPPSLAVLHRLENDGIGIRRAEGFGQVLFLRKGLLEGITAKKLKQPGAAEVDSEAVNQRRRRILWIMKTAPAVQQMALSASQLGSVQSQCEQAIAQGGDTTELEGFLQKNLTERGAKHGAKFERIAALIRDTLNQDSDKLQQLHLLCDLFDYQRKWQGQAKKEVTAE